jgi:hypothetical protein
LFEGGGQIGETGADERLVLLMFLHDLQGTDGLNELLLPLAWNGVDVY